MNASWMSPYAHALDTQFYSNNDIYLSDPTATDCAPGMTSAALTEEQKIGQLLLVGFDSTSIGEAMSAAQKYQLGGIYLNIQDPSKLTTADINTANATMKSQLIVATDDEGGQIHRMIAAGSEPSAKQLGTMTDAQVLASGKDTGTRLKKLGVNTVLAPVLDIDTGLHNAISPYDRSFSSNPSLIAEKAGAWADGVTSQGVGVTFKHFPGIGSNTGNTDTSYISMTTKRNISQYQSDLVPYNDARIRDHASSAVMLANFVLPDWGSDPVSVNANAVSYLRDTVGYHGLITTDDLAVMTQSGYGTHTLSLEQSVVKALNAKVDMPLFAYPGDAEMATIIAAVSQGVSSTVIDAAYQDMISYKTSLGLSTTPPSTTQAVGAVSPVVSGNDNRSKIYTFLISTSFKGYGNKPFGPVQAAGAVGNFYQESGWRFDAVEPNGAGHGIAQWSFGRWTGLQNLASSMNKAWSTPEVQFQMIKNELDGSYGKSLLDQGYASLTDPAAAAQMFEKIYEGAGIPNQKNRDEAAVKALKELAGITAGPAFTSSSCSTTNGQASTATFNTTKASLVTSDGFPVYLQTDSRWSSKPYSSSTVGVSGSGPSVMAMLVTALSNQAITPDQTAAIAASDGMYLAGIGSSWDIAPDLAKHYSLVATKASKNVTVLNQALQGGGYIIMSGAGSLPFTTGGQYIAIRGVTTDGKWRVAVPNDQTTSDQTFDPATILSMADEGSIYIISKGTTAS